MKKAILAAIVLVASCLSVVGVSSPASADRTPDDRKKSCADPVWKKSSTDFDTGGSGVAVITTEARVKVCNGGQYAVLLQLGVEINPTGSINCAPGFGDVERWYANPDKVGSWNPGEKSVACKSTTTTNIGWTPPSGLTVYRGAAQSARCIGGHIEAALDSYFNVGKSMGRVCIL